jgi:peptidoglycan/LPS O-acetylase OafA/YrhL
MGPVNDSGANVVALAAPQAAAAGSQRSAQAQYRTDIDGLRGVAIAFVCLFHTGIAGFGGGFVGVDVFFVISGFVITRTLLRDLETGRLSLRRFFIRRIRRLAPALAVLLLACVLTFSVLYPPAYLRDFGASVVAQALFVSNVYFWRTSTYFGTPPEAKPLLHTWSLSIEEQFYLFFAVAFVFLCRQPRAFLIKLLAGLWCASFLLGVFATVREPNASFFLLPTRAWELLTGVLVALWLDTYGPGIAGKRSIADLLGALGLSAIIVAGVVYSPNTPFPYVYAALPVLGAAMLATAERPGIAATLLGNTPLVLLGRISYSLYLWHWVAVALVRWVTLGTAGVGARSLAILACVPVAALSWRYVETPIRQRRWLGSDRAIVLFAVSTTAIAVAFGALAWRSGGFPFRARAALAGFQAPAHSPREHECFDDDSRKGMRFCQIGTKDAPLTFIAIGDSHAMSFLPTLELLAGEHHVRGMFAGTSGCPPFLGVTPLRDAASAQRCRQMSSESLRMAKELHVRQLILIGRWSYYTGFGPDGHFQAITNAGRHGVTGSDSRAVFAEQLRATIEAYAAIGATVNVVLQTPEQRSDPEGFLYRRALPAMLGGLGPGLEGTLDLAQHRRDQQFEDAVFARTPGIRTFDPAPRLCPDSGTCLLFLKGRPLYFDATHLSVAGSEYVAPVLEPLFSGIAGSEGDARRAP